MIDRAIATPAGSAAAAWQALTEVTAWPTWTTSVIAVVPLDEETNPHPRLGRRYEVRQPGMRPLVWKVTEIHEGKSFTWQTTMPGLTLVGRHWVDIHPDGTTAVANSIEHRGPLARVVRALTGRRTRRYLELEIAGLAQASRSAGTDPA